MNTCEYCGKLVKSKLLCEACLDKEIKEMRRSICITNTELGTFKEEMYKITKQLKYLAEMVKSIQKRVEHVKYHNDGVEK